MSEPKILILKSKNKGQKGQSLKILFYNKKKWVSEPKFPILKSKIGLFHFSLRSVFFQIRCAKTAVVKFLVPEAKIGISKLDYRCQSLKFHFLNQKRGHSSYHDEPTQ